MPAKIKFTDEQVRDIVTRYQGGETTTNLGKAFGCDSTVILRRIIVPSGIKLRRKKVSTHKQLDMQKVKELYEAGKTIKDCCKIFNCSGTCVLNALRVTKTTMRNFGSKHQYSINHNYFEVIDTEEKAYWLGFLATDGNIGDKKATIEIGLQNIDIKHLEKFSKAVGSNRPISNIDDEAKHVRVNSIKMKNDLAKYGIVARKTGKVFFSPLVPKYLAKHFWRGCIDGDGCLTAQSKNSSRISLIGNEEFINDFISFCKDYKFINYNISKCKKVKSFNCFTIAFYKDSKNIMELLYKDAKIYLDRKFERYELFTNKLDWLL